MYRYMKYKEVRGEKAVAIKNKPYILNLANDEYSGIKCKVIRFDFPEDVLLYINNSKHPIHLNQSNMEFEINDIEINHIKIEGGSAISLILLR